MMRKPPPRPNRTFVITITSAYGSTENYLGKRRCEEFLAAVQGIHPTAVATEMPTLANKYGACVIQIPASKNNAAIEDFVSDPQNFVTIAKKVAWEIGPPRWRDDLSYDAEFRRMKLTVSPSY